MNLLICDVDGVFTNGRAVPNQEAIKLSAQVAQHAWVTYVTGRGGPWLKRHLIPPLFQAYKRYNPVTCLMWAEYGTVLLRAGKQSTIKPFPQRRPLVAQVRKLIAPLKGVFFDEDKKVTITVEARHDLLDTTPDVVSHDLEQAETILRKLVSTIPEVEFHRTTYACDITPKGVGKESACRDVLDKLWFIPDHVHIIGDSRSDLPLANPIMEKNFPLTFWFVGDKKNLSPEDLEIYKPRITKQRYAEGTIEVLNLFTHSSTHRV